MPNRISAPFAFVKRGTYLPPHGAPATLPDMEKRSAKPTYADIAAAVRLKAAWDRARETRGITQADVARELGISQPAVSQYLLGKIPLGFDMLMRFASYFGIDPNTIRQDLPEQKHLPNALSSLQLQGDIMALQMTIRSLVYAVVSNIPAAAKPFVEHLEAQAEEAGFWQDVGLIASVLNIAQPGHHTEVKDHQPRKRRGSVA